ncbi:DUF4145 domain-containing protein [Kitasatospora sp. NPDC056138]|uniref:DUF4145 domain-containing protein n=1 Tax=Kitasatospora sp. NPDC056138 TaxID=3345724 RepID=UPI0035E29665
MTLDGSDRVGTAILVSCSYCEQPVIARVAGVVADHNLENGPPSLLQLVRCDRCGQGVLAVEEDYGFGWDGEPAVVWPKKVRSTTYPIPEALWREQDEAKRCFSAKAYTAAAVMVRRTLEGVCVEQGVRSGRDTLVTMLRKLKDQDKIDDRLLEWAQELRMLGNEGAHYTGRAVDPEDVADGLALADALLDYLYVYSAQFEKFQERRANRKKASEKTSPDASRAAPGDSAAPPSPEA